MSEIIMDSLGIGITTPYKPGWSNDWKIENGVYTKIISKLIILNQELYDLLLEMGINLYPQYSLDSVGQ